MSFRASKYCKSLDNSFNFFFDFYKIKYSSLNLLFSYSIIFRSCFMVSFSTRFSSSEWPRRSWLSITISARAFFGASSTFCSPWALSSPAFQSTFRFSLIILLIAPSVHLPHTFHPFQVSPEDQYSRSWFLMASLTARMKGYKCVAHYRLHIEFGLIG